MEHVDRLAAELAQKIALLVTRAASIDASLKGAVLTASQRAKADADQAKEAADDKHRLAVATANESTEARGAMIRKALEEIVSSSSSAAFVDDIGVSSPDEVRRLGAPSLVRRGSRDDGPAMYPLFHDRGWFLEGRADLVLEEIQSIVLRSVAGLPLKHLRIDVFDPRVEGRLGAFAQLRASHPSAFPIPATSAEALLESLKSVTRSAAENAELIATEHVKNIGEAWRSRGLPTGDYRFVVVLDYPEGITRETQDHLLRLARTGGPNGVVLLVQHDPSGRPRDEAIHAEELAAQLRKSRNGENGLLLAGYPEDLRVIHDGGPSQTALQNVLAAAIESATGDTGPVIPLEELIRADSERPWSGDATDGVGAVIGRAGQRELRFDLRSQNPPLASALVGGAVGQGKSNLLLDIIYALAAKYSPSELEFHLLDFKRGLEFQRFGADAERKNWLPHVKVLSLESDRAFGVAVLRHVAGELNDRSKQFKSAGVRGIEDFRVATGQRMSRLLLIIDEFQVIFEGDDPLVDEAVELLELISRQGRAYGVHLLMSSQTTSGISGLRVKGESIFSQFPLRISLKNTPTESEAILSQGNRAAADLTYRGEVIVNRNFGSDPDGSNERAVCAFAEPAFVAGLQTRLWELSPGGAPPLVFVSTEFAQFPSLTGLVSEDGRGTGFLGRPVAVTDQPIVLTIEEDIDQSIAVVGSDEALALPVLGSLAVTLSLSLEVDRVVVIDMSQADSARAGEALAPALASLASRGLDVRRVGRAQATETLGGMIRGLLTSTAGPRTLVVGIGLQRWAGLDETRADNPDDEDDYSTYTPREVLADLAQRGALNGAYFVGWWTTLRALSDQVGYNYDGIRHFITARLGLEDYRAITSHTAQPVHGYPRVGYFDRASDGDPQTVVPFNLEDVSAS